MNEIIINDERLYRNRMKWSDAMRIMTDEELTSKYGKEVVYGVALAYCTCRDVEFPSREEFCKMCEEALKNDGN